LPIDDELSQRFILFAQRCFTSECTLVRSVAHHSLISSPTQSPLGKNIVMSCLRYNVVIDDFMFISRNYIHNFAFSQLDNNIMSTTNLLLELFSIRAGLFKFSSDRLSVPDAQLLIDWIATM
jgi:hypothetical protein